MSAACPALPLDSLIARRHGAAITALVYHEGAFADPLLRRIAAEAAGAGLRLAGFVARERERPERHRCDMLLEDLATGRLVDITQDRGPLARGCRLDVGALVSVIDAAVRAVTAGADLVIVNKFGKTEAEGGGLRALVVAAVEAGVPVLIAVPARNLDAFRAFADGLAAEIPIETLAAAGSAPGLAGAAGRSVRA
jgi:nucleoside-triphosphatase THEP1